MPSPIRKLTCAAEPLGRRKRKQCCKYAGSRSRESIDSPDRPWSQLSNVSGLY